MADSGPSRVPGMQGGTAPVFTDAERNHLASIADRTKRGMYLVGLLSSRLAPTPVVIVGGFAVEFYTTGNYRTSDIDLVCMDAARIYALLAELAFVPDPKHRRHWLHPAHQLVVEVPGKSLDSPEMYRRLSTVEIDDQTALLIGIEDLIIDRLFSSVSEGRDDDWHWAREMMAIHHDGLDLVYLQHRAEEQRIAEGWQQLANETRAYLDERQAGS